jgi:hypothetical protein
LPIVKSNKNRRLFLILSINKTRAFFPSRIGGVFTPRRRKAHETISGAKTALSK